MGSRRLQWLGGVPTDILAKLRLDNENVKFRDRLSAVVGRLHETVFDDVDRVAAEVCHELESMIADHEKDLRLIQRKYNRMHSNTAILTLAAAGAALMPALAPFLGSVAPPLLLAAKYGNDKVNELAEKRILTRSFVGVLAAAKGRRKGVGSL
jgi:hypothetical protein